MAFSLILTCAILLSVCLCYTVLDDKLRATLLQRFHFNERSDSNEQTILASLSLQSAASTRGTESNYRDQFPPSRRIAFAEIYAHLPPALKAKKLKEDIVQDPPPDRQHVPLTTPFDQLSGNEYTPTGFSVEEIRQLGNFPDYAALSGVHLPDPYENFDIAKALPRPYRPFRWGYFQTMSLTKLEPDYWLELENTYKQRIRQRQELFDSVGPLVLQHLPGSELACKELLEMVIQFLVARYPAHFTLDERSMIFYNRILNTQTCLEETHPLHVLLEHVPEDFCIMLRNPEDGFYTFRAGVLCSAVGWNMGTKIGKKLHEIHEPVPGYKEKMQLSMDRYFARKPTDKAIQRGSWSLEIDQPLFMPPGSAKDLLYQSQDPSLDLSRLNLRVDWQTLRRLPLSGAIVFNFKALFTPITAFRDEPYIPALLLKILEAGNPSILEYKDTWHTEHVTKPALRKWKGEQEEKGLTQKDWEPATLEESPWYPGWEEKWKKAQGLIEGQR